MKHWWDPLVLHRVEGVGDWTWLHVAIAVMSVAFGVWVLSDEDVNDEWVWLALCGGLTITLTPITSSPAQFFRAGLALNDSSLMGLAKISISTFIAWVFAKSVYNASTLGAKYGIMGGVAYGTLHACTLTHTP